MSQTICSECQQAPCNCGQAYRYYMPDRAASLIWAVLVHRSPAERRDILERATKDLALSAVPKDG